MICSIEIQSENMKMAWNISLIQDAWCKVCNRLEHQSITQFTPDILN